MPRSPRSGVGDAGRRAAACAAASRCAPRPPSSRASRWRSTRRPASRPGSAGARRGAAPLSRARPERRGRLAGDEEVARRARPARPGSSSAQRRAGTASRRAAVGCADQVVGGRQRDGDVLAVGEARWPRCGRRPTGPGCRSPATNGSSSTCRSKTTCTLTIGALPQPGAQPAGRPSRAGRAAAGPRRRGGTARTTASAAGRSPARVRTAPAGPVRLEPRRPCCRQPHVHPGGGQRRRRGARRAAAAAAPRDQPMSAAPASLSSPCWNTVAASASEASSAGALSVATPTRSHSAATAAGDCPCAASQLAEGRGVGRPGRRGRPGAQRQARPRRAEPLGTAQRRVATRATRPGAAAPAAGSGAAGPRPLGLSGPGTSSRGCRRGERSDAEPVEQPAVGGAAAQEHVLAVVDGQTVAAERVRGAPEPRRAPRAA